MPWYEIPRYYRENRAQLLEGNDGFVFRGYGEIARKILVSAGLPPGSPLPLTAAAEKRKSRSAPGSPPTSHTTRGAKTEPPDCCVNLVRIAGAKPPKIVIALFVDERHSGRPDAGREQLGQGCGGDTDKARHHDAE